MSTIEEATIGHQPIFSLESAIRQRTYTANTLLATTPRAESLLLPHVASSGSIREYSRIGDGVHLMRHQLPLLPLMERTRPRPHTLVRKVTVMGSHVLRYVSRNSNLSLRRHLHQSFQRVRMTRIDQQMNNYNAYNYDQVDSDWLGHNDEPEMPNSRWLRFQQAPYSDRLMLRSNLEDNSIVGLFNWRIYLGMLCIIAAQALFKLAFEEMYNMS